jgi:hypothetical protein
MAMTVNHRDGCPVNEFGPLGECNCPPAPLGTVRAAVGGPFGGLPLAAGQMAASVRWNEPRDEVDGPPAHVVRMNKLDRWDRAVEHAVTMTAQVPRTHGMRLQFTDLATWLYYLLDVLPDDQATPMRAPDGRPDMCPECGFGSFSHATGCPRHPRFGEEDLGESRQCVSYSRGCPIIPTDDSAESPPLQPDPGLIARKPI